MGDYINQLLSNFSQAYTWGNAVIISFTAASMAVALIQFLYWRS